MSHYLVTVGTLLDDYPVRLFNFYSRAFQYARECGLAAVAAKAADLAGRDGPGETPNVCCIWTFEDGVPVKCDVVERE